LRIRYTSREEKDKAIGQSGEAARHALVGRSTVLSPGNFKGSGLFG
jgi:hypothetical protein